MLQTARYLRAQSPAILTRDEVAQLRDAWPGTLIVKGILAQEDVAALRSLGADGLIVSNHGGRQLARAVASLDALPAVRHAVGPAFPVMLDGGVRRGSDVATALRRGADFVFVGRPMLYGAAIAAQAGVARAIQLLRHELAATMGQIGASEVRRLDPSFIREA